MKITMLCVGSTGDVRPYIILGRELKARGYDVAICAFSIFEEMALREGLRFKPLPGDAKRFMGSFMTGSNGVMFLKQAKDALVELMNPMLTALENAVEDAEVIIGSYLGQVFQSLAEVKRVPYIQTQYFPMDENKLAPIASAPGQRAGMAWNLATYRLGHLLVSILEKYYLDDWREKHGMSPRRLTTAPSYELNGHTVPVLYAMSPLIMPRPANWGENIHMTGFWMGRLESSYEPEPELKAFLEAGDAPIYIGFGSMVSEEMGETLEAVLDAIRRSGVRAILSTGWGGAQVPQRDDLYVAEYVPHDWLFQHVSAVVHHGGAGTTAAGILAEKPTLIIPFGGDQPFWGNRAYTLGIGPKPIPRDKLNADRLTRAFTDLTTTKKYRVAARELGLRLRMENGVQTAADLIEHELREWLIQEGRTPDALPDHPV